MRVFITGSTTGFGLEMAKAFKRSGHSVILNSRKDLLFITDMEFVKSSMNDITAKDLLVLHPDIVVNNGFSKEDYLGSLGGQVNMLKESIKYFESVGGGKIVNINSSMGILPDKQFPEYAMAKWGLRGYSESVKFDAYLKGINIIDLYPGAINTGMAAHRQDCDEIIDAKELSEFIITLCSTKKFIVSTIHINRMGVKK